MEQIKLIKNENNIYYLSRKTPLHNIPLDLFFALFVYDGTDMDSLSYWLENSTTTTFDGNLCFIQKMDLDKTSREENFENYESLPKFIPGLSYVILSIQQELSEYNEKNLFMTTIENFKKTIDQWIEIKRKMPDEITITLDEGNITVE